jgi:hypothetical protein
MYKKSRYNQILLKYNIILIHCNRYNKILIQYNGYNKNKNIIFVIQVSALLKRAQHSRQLYAAFVANRDKEMIWMRTVDARLTG